MTTTQQSDRDTFPLTDLQAGYLVGSSDLIELGGFRPTMYLEFDMVDFDPVRAEHAINQLIRRHEHLRTVILTEGAQRVLDDPEVAPFRLLVVDVVGLDAQRQEAAIRQTRQRMRDGGVDPTGWPLFEIVAHRVRPHRTRVHFAMSLLLLDSRSTRHLQDDWFTLYHDPQATLPPLARTFRDCVHAQLADQDSEAYRRHWAYWEDRLDTLPQAPRLPLARPLASINPVRMTRREHYLSREQWQRFTAAVRANRLMPNTALIHAFAEVLGGWADSPRFCLNVLHQNWATNHPETEGVVGQFSSTLPLEIDPGDGADFWARAQRTQRQLWKDMSHSDVTAVRVTRELAARHGWTSRAALPYVFNSMLGPDRQAAPLRRPSCRTVISNLRTPQVLIDNQIIDGPRGSVGCVWDVVDDAFPPGLPDLMFEAYRTLLDTIAGPDGSRARPDVVPASHRAVVEADNRGDLAPPAGRLEDGFLRRAADRPDAPAVVTSGRTLTYRGLEEASRAVADWLRERAVGRGDVVPVIMTKGWEQVVAVLGVLRSGAAYCPIDANLPVERIGQLIDECGARTVLQQSHHAREVGEVPVLYVDQPTPRSSGSGTPDGAGQPPDGARRLPGAPGTDDDLAYIIYTSGSTGRPKGVMIEHRAALNTIVDVNERVGLGTADRVFGISSLSFDLSVWDVFGALAAGAALVLPDATVRPDPIGWAATARAYGVTVWNSVPALAEMLVEVCEQTSAAGSPADTDAAPPIRAFLLSGDWIPTSLPGRMRALWPQVRTIAMGGATEASIWSNIFEIDRVEASWRSVPYGRPLRNQTMRVLDHRLQLRPPWAVGAIHIGGVGLSRGYFRDEQRTGERFARHPVTGERLYRTGDLGRYWPDGTIEFLGREDRQLKIQGFRVEPGEIESAIRSHPAVRDCAVGAAQAPGGQRRLVSLVIPADGTRLDGATLAGYLRERLPHYMVPGQIQMVDQFPLSANGKVDISAAAGATEVALVPSAAGTGTPEAEMATGDGALVSRLAALSAELLELPTVGPDDDFFTLGGNSLLALRLVNRVRTDLGLDLRFGEIFEASTMRALAARLSASRRAASCAVALSGGEGSHLYLFHPVGGSVTSYLDLARAWPGPVHAFQSPGLSGDGAGPDGAGPVQAPSVVDLEGMAARYREELQRLDPHGPYLLGGWSMGGVLAYEVARQLVGLGHESRIFMIDSDVRNLRRPDSALEAHREFLSDLAGGRLPEAVADAIEGASPTGLARAAHDAAVAHGLLPTEVDVAGYERLRRVHGDNLELLARYQPGKLEAPTLLFVAGSVTRPDPVPAWRAVCPDIEVDVWPDDHYSIVTAQRLREIAGRVRAWANPSHAAPAHRASSSQPSAS